MFPRPCFKEIIQSEKNANGKCHKIRMGLTLLCNLAITGNIKETDYCKYMSDESYFDDKINNVSLFDFYNCLKQWYTSDDEIKKILRTLFRISENSFELFAIVYNLNLNTKKDEKSFNEIFTEQINKLIEKKDESELQSIEIKTNPCAVIYIQKIFIHYEYFNLLSEIKGTYWKDEDICHVKTLFQKLRSGATANSLKLFMNNVYQVTKNIILNADQHFCDTYKLDKNSTEQQYNEKINEFISMGGAVNGALFTARLITSHINYLDEFRKYILNNDAFKNEFKIEMQNIIVEVIKKYLNLYYKERYLKDTTISAIMKIAQDHIKEIEKENTTTWNRIMPETRRNL
jgi:hypothetical protein